MGPVIIDELRTSAKASGLDASGELVSTIEVEAAGTTLQVELNAYGIYLDAGVPPSRVKTGKKYIQGIQRWLRQKGLPEDIAWAIAKTHQKKGIPVDKRKLGWIDRGLANAFTKAPGIVAGAFKVAFEASQATIDRKFNAIAS